VSNRPNGVITGNGILQGREGMDDEKKAAFSSPIFGLARYRGIAEKRQ
jgi:hypothetical protein